MKDREGIRVVRAPPKYLDIAGALARYPIGRTTLYTLIKANCIETRKLGARVLIDLEAADRFFEELPSASNARRRFKLHSTKG